VQSSKFITHKKTLALIKKIEGLASIYDAQLLQRQVYVHGRVKSMNESVYYNVDEISDAISRDLPYLRTSSWYKNLLTRIPVSMLPSRYACTADTTAMRTDFII